MFVEYRVSRKHFPSCCSHLPKHRLALTRVDGGGDDGEGNLLLCRASETFSSRFRLNARATDQARARECESRASSMGRKTTQSRTRSRLVKFNGLARLCLRFLSPLETLPTRCLLAFALHPRATTILIRAKRSLISRWQTSSSSMMRHEPPARVHIDEVISGDSTRSDPTSS